MTSATNHDLSQDDKDKVDPSAKTVYKSNFQVSSSKSPEPNLDREIAGGKKVALPEFAKPKRKRRRKPKNTAISSATTTEEPATVGLLALSLLYLLTNWQVRNDEALRLMRCHCASIKVSNRSAFNL